MLQRHPLSRGHSGDCGDLVEHQVFNFAWGQAHFAAAKAAPVRESRVDAHRDAMRLRTADRLSQERWIARMKPGGHAHRGDDGEQCVIFLE
jgi:hypothetical protein